MDISTETLNAKKEIVDLVSKYEDIVECFGLPEYTNDPYPFYKKFREKRPIYFSKLTNSWHLFKYEDVLSVYKDARFARGDNSFVNQLGVDAARSFGRWMQWKNGRDHMSMRQSLQAPFTKSKVSNLYSKIESALDMLLESMPESGVYDIYSECLYKMPVLIICDLLGIPREDFQIFVKWSSRLSVAMDPAPSPEQQAGNNAVIRDMEEYLYPLFRQKEKSPGDDLISKLIMSKNAPGGMTEEDIMSQVIMMFFAGHETTTNQLAFGMLELLKDPEQWELLKSSSDYLDSAVEELLRIHTPVVFIQYRTQEDLEFKGHNMPKGTCVWLYINSANRDPEVFENPDKLDIRRTHNPHLAFGKSTHQCLGADLSRLEIKLTLQKLVNKLNGRKIELESVKVRPSLFIRGVEHLTIKISP